MTRPVPWLERLTVTNFRSIARTSVTFGPLTVLIGPNGAGKSNVFDALRFLVDAVSFSPYQAVEERGGFSEVLRRVPSQQDRLDIEIDAVVPWGPTPEQYARGSYGFSLTRTQLRGRRPLEVSSERCVLRWQDKIERFTVRQGHVEHPGAPGDGTVLEPDRLYLPAASGLPNLAPLERLIRTSAFYSLDVATLRRPEPEAEGVALGERGEHLADVLGQLDSQHPGIKNRLDDYLTAIVPDIVGVDRAYAGNYVTVEARQRFAEGVSFGANALSEGTIRAAGVLAALFQPWVREEFISFVGLEEPELALHPSAAGVLFDALTEASRDVQIIATSQSADLLDRDDVDPGMVRAVISRNGLTEVGNIDSTNLRTLDQTRLTLGELMRRNQVRPGEVA